MIRDQVNPIINPIGLTMHVLNRDNAIALLKGMLAAQRRPAIHFIRSEEVLSSKQLRHTYRFFIINIDELFNVSGLITAVFASTVQDRAQAFSVNSLNAEDDLKQFWDALKRFTEIERLELIDILTGTSNVLDLTINQNVLDLFPNEDICLTQNPRFSTNSINPEEPTK
jgi:hypothetical protein